MRYERSLRRDLMNKKESTRAKLSLSLSYKADLALIAADRISSPEKKNSLITNNKAKKIQQKPERREGL